MGSKNKDADQLCSYFAVTAQLICAFVFAYACCWFSYVVAHIRKKFKNLFSFDGRKKKITKVLIFLVWDLHYFHDNHYHVILKRN